MIPCQRMLVSMGPFCFCSNTPILRISLQGENSIMQDVEFRADDGTMLRGWLKTPPGPGPHPLVVMTHGAGGHKEWFLPGLSDILQAAGIASLAYDHRNFGQSEGEPRFEIDPPLQIRDYRTAITFACTLPEVDKARIGIFGTSLSGGHVLVVAALDRRVRCVVSQVPSVSGSASATRRYHPEELNQNRRRWDEDRMNRFLGKPPATVAHSVDDPNDAIAGQSSNRVKFFRTLSAEENRHWKNTLTLRSLEALADYEPGIYARLISPTPLLMIISEAEAQLALPTFQSALEPKKVVITRGDHYDPYMDAYDTATGAAREWFAQWLAR